MYSLDCSYYNYRFKTLDELFHHILSTGMDPNYKITYNGYKTEEMACDLIEYYSL